MRKYLLYILFCLMSSISYAKDIYSYPNISKYYASLQMPDSLASCCGEAEVYYADKTDSCSPSEQVEYPGCALVAIITDTRPDKKTLPDGRILVRMHIDPGTRIIVEQKKIRKKPIPNPTDHNIIFENSSWFPEALCWEPMVEY